ncbi:MAG: PorP/SprF family type IX secretion system membrane protein [Bacteroidetes bacterium]|jgi:type IX secretion system PorP/SprF family membrane protein|nr:PorP/SprF family type IX secretion system membrane protein [Bacteroidota bacterium]
MKKATFAFVLALSGLMSQAQQIPLFSQYYNNEFLYNPSQVLTEDYSSLSLFYRKQWISSQSPLVSQGLVFQSPIKVEKVGLGVSLINDKHGIFNRTGGSMAYSYRIDLNEEHRLLLGLAAGFMNTNYDWNSDISLLADPRFAEAITDRVTSFDATFGLTYAWKGLEVGFAIPHLLDKDLDFMNREVLMLYYNYRHYVGSASYLFEFDKISLRPLVLARYQPAVSPVIDANLVFGYDQKVWAAVGYRQTGALTFGIGGMLHERLSVGYSYDMGLNSDISQYFGATHEINFSIKFGRSEVKPKEVEVVEDTLTLEILQQQINLLKKENKGQQTTIDDHEKRIGDLENQLKADSLQKKMEEILDEMEIGSGSVDYRGNEVTLGPGSRKVVNPDDPNGLFGYKEDGTPISPYEKYEGPVYHDNEGKRIVADPANPDVELYDEEGNPIDDINTYTGRVRTKDGKYVKDKDGNVIYYDNGGDGDDEENPGTGTKTGTRPGTKPGNGTGNTGTKPGSGSSATIPTYEKPELAKEGIRYTAPGNYVVVASFRNKDNAIKMREELQDKGYSAGIVYNHFRKWFYVYAFESKDFNKTLDELRKERAGTFKDAWVHVIIE